MQIVPLTLGWTDLHFLRKMGARDRLKSVRNGVAARFVRHLRLELEAIIDRTLSIANAATFRHQRKGGQLVTMLELTGEQRTAAGENRERLIRWSSAVVSFLRRRGAAGDTEIEQLTSDLTPCVTLQWTDRDDVPERQWRTKLHRELLRVSAEAARHIGSCAVEEALGMALEPKPFSPFPLRIEALGHQRWRVCAGELATERMTLPKHFALAPTSPEHAEPFGRALFDLVFAGSVGEAFRCARLQGNVRIQLDTGDAGALHALPWELLHDGDQFLGLSARVSLVRYVAGAKPARSRTLQPPLRILVMVSAPREVAFLDGEHERATLEAALAPLTMLGLVEIDVVAGSSFTALRRRLRAAENAGRPHHAWHFIGHGGDDVLVMTDDTGHRRDVSSAELETLFKEHRSLGLVVLNSCDGVRFDAHGATSGVAVAFLASGAQAVVAMRFPILDPAAVLLAEEVYGALSEGAVLDAALIEARRAIFFQPYRQEWFIPVLLMAGS